MKKWYAVQENSEDAWDYGSESYSEAVQMLKDQGHGLIAVIEVDEYDTLCVDEIEYEELEDEGLFIKRHIKETYLF